MWSLAAGSTSVFIYCYMIAFSNLTRAMCYGLAALFVRQFGHAILEPSCHDQEKALLGFNTWHKTLVVLGSVLVFVWHLAPASTWTWAALSPIMGVVAQQWFFWTLLVVGGRVLYLVWAQNLRTALIWLVKLLTDPFTDMVTYVMSPYGVYRALLPQVKSASK